MDNQSTAPDDMRPEDMALMEKEFKEGDENKGTTEGFAKPGNMQNVENMQNSENEQNTENAKILGNAGNVQNAENAQNAGNGENTGNTENAGRINFECSVKQSVNTNMQNEGDMQKRENETVGKVNIKCNDDVSKGFLSPPVFHLTEIMHNERCFKRTKGHISVEINGDICIYGGMAQNKCIDNFIRYVPGINLFEKMRLNSNDISPRAYHTGNVITEDNKKIIVVFGGINDKDKIIDETYKFDFQAKKWERVENKVNPCHRYKHASFSFNDTVYIHGGLNHDNYLLNDLWCLSGNIWKEIKQIDKTPDARYGHSLIFSQYGNAQLVFLFGGNKKGFNGALSDTWIFNINTNRWKELFDNEWMIIYGGITNGWIDNYALSDMYALNIYTFSWFEVDISTSKGFNRGYYGSLCLVPYKKSLHVFGGSDESYEYSDVFSLSPLVTYVSYKNLTGKIEQLNSRMKNINENANDNEHVNLAEFEMKIIELKEEVNGINSMMKTFESKFSALEKLNEQCEKLLSKNINSEALEKLEQRIRKLESSNALMKHDSI
ncbi:kelch domain-containing protein [Plasmodium ovale wallikeri]|uniref:Kelch domain-containing protein n=1 Tax=Plasmodium ovale wallikeri TaxID=864142 RepID=A0A1A8YVU4_PLAOA|nr:kelch domain-containing protein [Plasmodium ovale wallikeri]